MEGDILPTLAQHRVKTVTFPPHRTNIFQCLDLSLFGILKKKMNCKPFRSDDSVAALVKRIFHNLKQTLLQYRVRSAFVHIGIQYIIDAERYLLIFDEFALRESPGFPATGNVTIR
jgi:hypothetical protein